LKYAEKLRSGGRRKQDRISDFNHPHPDNEPRAEGNRGESDRSDQGEWSRARTRRNHAPEWFRCAHCGGEVSANADGIGTHQRNHCPGCLWSKHLDNEPGDRASDCHGGMEPIAVWARPGGDWAIIHRCRSCGELKSNRIAGDDNELLLVTLATRALAQTPFPLSRLMAVNLRE